MKTDKQQTNSRARISRRDGLRLGATGIMASLLPASVPAAAQTQSSNKKGVSVTDKADIRPFSFKASKKDLDDLRRRVAATKWPDVEQVADDSQGVRLATMQKLAQYWVDQARLAQVRGEDQRRAATSSPRSTGSTSISFTSARSMKMRCR